MNRHHLQVAGAAVTALAIAGAVSFLLPPESEVTQGRTPSPARPSPDAPWTETPCSPGLVEASSQQSPARAALCGRLRVPESRGSARTIEVGVIRLIPREPLGHAPLLFIPGGPGDAFSHDLEHRLPLLAPLAGNREILIVDQRGTGMSVPLLECRRNLKRKENLAECFSNWNADLDPGTFNTHQSAKDLTFVLGHFNLNQVAVYGVSYGTRIALELAASHPALVERLLVDSPVPRSIDVLGPAAAYTQRALQEIAEACDQAEDCKDARGFQLSDLTELVMKMNKAKEGSGTRFLSTLAALSVTSEVVPFVPLMISQARSGKFGLLNELREGFSDYEFSRGLHLSVQCAETFPLTSAQVIEDAEVDLLSPFRVAFSNLPYVEQCALWAVPPREVPRGEAQVSTPTLVLSGRHDPSTPPAYGELVGKGLAKGRQIIVESASHGVALSECGAGIARTFFEHGLERATDAVDPCASEGPRFALTPPSKAERVAIVSRIRYRL